jgi:hypothetical protein
MSSRSAISCLRLAVRFCANALFLVVALVPAARGQVSYATAGAAYSQTFNAGLPAASNNSATWTNNSTFPGWYIYRVTAGSAPSTYRINSTSSSGEVQQFRSSASATDGALGGRPNDTTGDLLYGVRLVNNTGTTLQAFSLSFTGEQWYASGSSTVNKLKVSYQFGSPATLATGTWTDVQPLVFSSLQNGGTAGDLNGSLSGNQTVLATSTVNNLAWAPGTELWIRFSDDNSSGVDHGLALDDVTFSAFTYQPGTTYMGAFGYTEYRAGNLPIVITAPHGGDVEPGDIPDRTASGAVTTADANTEDLARKISAEIYLRTGKYVHLVICHLHRSKLDVNRALDTADGTDQALDNGSAGPATAVTAWHDYHNFAGTATAATTSAVNFGFLTDIHGQAHTPQRIEVGYNLSASQLNLSDSALEHPAYGENSTLRTLLQQASSRVPLVIRGARSWGDFMVQRGYAAVPSPAQTGPGTEDYFNGGYTVETHTSLTGQGRVQGLQLECNMTGVRDNSGNRQAFAETVAATLNDYLFDHFGYELGAGPIYRLTTSADRMYEGGSTPTAVTLTIARTGYVKAGTPNESVAVTLGGTATGGGVDYTASAASVTFAPADTSKTITLTAVSDADDEGAESIVASLAPTGVQTAVTTPLTIALSDDDRTSVSIALANPAMNTLTEGGAAINLTVTRDRVFNSNLYPTITFSGTAVRGTDYAVSGLNGSDQAWIAPNQASASITITPSDNGTLDPRKTIIVSVANGGVYRNGVPDTTTLYLLDNDQPTDLALWLPGTTGDGVIRDESGHDRHGAIHPATGGATTGTGHTAGKTAVFFDGTDDALAFPRFDFVGSGSAFTVAFRFRIDSTGTTSTRYFFNVGPFEGLDTLNIYHSESTSKLHTVLKDDGGSPSSTALAISSVTNDGLWHHYALTVSASGGVKVYLDGTLKTSTTWSGIFTIAEPLWLGWRAENSTSRNYKGGMEDVRVYSRALSGTEVSALAAP